MPEIKKYNKKIRAAEGTYLVANVKGDIKILARFLNEVVDKLNEVIEAVNELKAGDDK